MHPKFTKHGRFGFKGNPRNVNPGDGHNVYAGLPGSRIATARQLHQDPPLHALCPPVTSRERAALYVPEPCPRTPRQGR